MLEETDKTYLIEALLDFVATLESPRQTLTAPFIGTTLPEELVQGRPRELVLEVVRLCVNDRWDHDPPWIALLLDILPNEPKIAEIRAFVLKKPPRSADPLESTILNNGAPFVNRGDLRHHLRRLATDAAVAQPILVVNGTAKIGKSYTASYIEHFSQHHPRIIPYRLELDPEVALAMGPEQVASDMVSMMGRPLGGKPQPETNLKLYARQLASWVLNQATQSPDYHWFVLDNFHGNGLRADTREFLVSLSALITTGIFPRRCRLILLGFDRSLLTVDPGKVEEEVIGPCSTDHVKICIAEILKRAPVALDKLRVQSGILDSLPNGTEWLAEINRRLRTLTEAVDGAKAILLGKGYEGYEEILLNLLQSLPSGKERSTELRQRLQELRESVAEIH